MLPEYKFQGESVGSSGQTGRLGPENDAFYALLKRTLRFYPVGGTLCGRVREEID